MIKICQLDPRWSDKKIGETNYTIGRWGCAISSICMILQKFRMGLIYPDVAAKKWRFTSNAEIIWRDSNFGEIEFRKRGYDFDIDVISYYANSDVRGVIISVNNDSHWVAVSRIENGQVYILDPLNNNGEELLPSHYSISGYAGFFGDVFKIPEWAKDAIAAAQKKGFNSLSPNELNQEIDPVLLSYMCQKIGHLKEAPKRMTKLEFITWAYKNGLLS